MKIEDLSLDDEHAVEQVVGLLTDFAPNRAAAWSDQDSALDTIEEATDDDSIARIALDDAGNVVGFVAAAAQYTHAWELHPIVVARDEQGRGVGRALLTDIEERVATEGGLTIYLGADDLDESTSASDDDLFPDVLDKAQDLEVRRRRHPIGFFLHMGYEIVGIIPDANGPGRPDIWLARSVADLAEED